ncbi:hypothetical protein AX16_001569 [Volvariella volvacea WC 439]|nr:hypothetical protein AX16_001569 [Volvariella volvacea WC 439]
MTISHPATQKTSGSGKQHVCCGVTQDLKVVVAEKRNSDRPKPWIARKFMIVVTLGVMGYAAYVFIGRLCLQMLRRDRDATGSRGTGVALLSVFCVLYLWMIGAYIKIVVTSPGYAAHHVQESNPPFSPADFRVHQSSDIVEMDPHATTGFEQRFSSSSNTHTQKPIDDIGGASYEDMTARFSAEEAAIPQFAPTGDRSSLEGQFSRSPKISTTTMPTEPTMNASPLNTALGKLKKHSKAQKQRPYIARRAPTFPNLMPENRYCVVDKIIKPARTHHCRTCGTCILKYDHHCPWIGQCVGARNHKFFVNFLEATSVTTLYTLSVLLGFTLHGQINLNVDLDPQLIVGIAIAALFALFTTMLLLSHIRLIWISQSTVESVGMRHRKEQEERSLSRAYSWWECRQKKQKVREWNQEWGHPDTEGNPWWLGSGRQGWEDVMGKNTWGWFLPVGRSLNDGLRYPVNPRFDEQGRLRRREEWPEHLR